MWAGVAQGGLITPVLFILCDDFLKLAPRRFGSPRERHDHHSHAPKPTLLVSYLVSYLNDFQRRLSKRRIASNVSNSTAIIFARAGRRFTQPRTITLFGEPIQWVDTSCNVGMTLDTRFTWSPHIDQVRMRPTQRIGVLGPLLNRMCDSQSGKNFCYTSGSSAPLYIMRVPRGDPAPKPMSRGCKCYNLRVSGSLLLPPDT